jgi:hypothetical protein
MKKKVKKNYEKPRVTRVNLDAKTAVLGFCKTQSSFGPSGTSCGVPAAPCSGDGS